MFHNIGDFAVLFFNQIIMHIAKIQRKGVPHGTPIIYIERKNVIFVNRMCYSIP